MQTFHRPWVSLDECEQSSNHADSLPENRCPSTLSRLARTLVLCVAWLRLRAMSRVAPLRTLSTRTPGSHRRTLRHWILCVSSLPGISATDVLILRARRFAWLRRFWALLTPLPNLGELCSVVGRGTVRETSCLLTSLSRSTHLQYRLCLSPASNE